MKNTGIVTRLENMKKKDMNIKNSFYSVLVILGLLFASPYCLGQKMLLSKAKVHIGNGEVIEQGLVGIEDGKIILIKNALTYTYDPSEWDTIIDLKHQHLYPGFFAPNTTLGLTEVDAVRATRDFKEVGQYNPHIRSEIAFNVESKVVNTARGNGVLFAQATPRGGVVSGTSSVFHLHGWNWEDAVLNSNDGVHLNWPNTLQGGGWWAEPKPKTQNKKYGENKRAVYDFFTAAQAYHANKNHEYDARYEALKGVFNGNQNLYIHADELKQLLDVIDFIKDLRLSSPVLVGGYDSYLLTDQLKDAEIPVMLTRLHALPDNEDDPVDLVYRLPKLLNDGGVKFCLQNAGDMEAMQVRNIPFLAGSAMGYGLTEEEAVRSITLSAAEILNLDKEYGSIEVGKKATLFASKGNALDMRTNHVTLVLIDGEIAPHEHHQHELYRKYKGKYGK